MRGTLFDTAKKICFSVQDNPKGITQMQLKPYQQLVAVSLLQRDELKVQHIMHKNKM